MNCSLCNHPNHRVLRTSARFQMAIDTLSSIDDAEIISEESPEDYANGDMDCWQD